MTDVHRRALQVLAVLLGVAIVATPATTVASETPATTVASETPATAAGQETPALDPPDQTPDGIEIIYRSPSIERTAGGDGVDVAILDTGVDADHPDLSARVEQCRDYTGETVANGTCEDDNGHGTRVAGIVAADGGPDGDGLYGVAPAADLYVYKVCRADGLCRTSAMATAIRDAANAGAEVIVVSIGGRPTPHVQAAVRYAHREGALLVAAAGNSGPGLESLDYPAADRLVVGVGAVDHVGANVSEPTAYFAPAFSSRGKDVDDFEVRDGVIDVGAPGVDVLSTEPDGTYGFESGTSFAAPHVGGLAAKLWWRVEDANGNGKRNDDVRAALHERALDVSSGVRAGPGYDPAAGIGVPTANPFAPEIVLPSGAPSAGDRTTLAVSLAVPADTDVVAYEWDIDGDGTVDARGATVRMTFDSGGTHDVSVAVTDRAGQTVTVERTVSVNARPNVTVAVPSVVRPGVPVTLEATVVDDSPSASVTWEFPDGSVEHGRSITRQFESGTQHVAVVVEDEDGAVVRTTVEVVVPRRPPAPTTSQGGSSTTAPGFGLGVASTSVLVALLSVVVVFAVRTRRRNV